MDCNKDSLELTRRNLAVVAATPMFAALLSACVNEPAQPTTTIANPTVPQATAVIAGRHINTLLIRSSSSASVQRTIDLFWSHSCGDTMRAYKTQIKPLLVNPPTDAVIAVHLVARGAADVAKCIEIRSVNQDRYAQAVQALLEFGATKGTFISNSEVTQVLAPFAKNGEGFLSGFAENCLRLFQQHTLSAGVRQTPAVLVNGRSVSLESLRT